MRVDRPSFVPPGALRGIARSCAPRVTRPRACRCGTPRRSSRVHVCADSGTTVPDGRAISQCIGARRGACFVGDRRARGW
jgi:hypothetical protein